MADVLLFHHAHGLTDGLRAFADEVRAAGHHVELPDLFEGRTFTTTDEGVGHLFTDSSLEDHDPEAARLVIDRTIGLLGRLDRTSHPDR